MSVLSSALSTLVGAPRTLAALAEDRLVPFSKSLAIKAKNGEPRNAIVLSAIISLAVLLVGNLNMLASLLTLFFLMTYGTINLTVLIERKINLWLRDKSPNMNLAVLTALQLFRNWDGLLTLSRTITTKKEAAHAALQMESFKEKARLPVNTEINIIQGDFTKTITSYNTDIRRFQTNFASDR